MRTLARALSIAPRGLRAELRPSTTTRKKGRRRFARRSAINEWDVIVWKGRVGRVDRVERDTISCEELQAGEDNWWTLSDSTFTVDSASEEGNIRVVEYDYEQRQIQDRIANPHSEHAEEIFFLHLSENE